MSNSGYRVRAAAVDERPTRLDDCAAGRRPAVLLVENGLRPFRLYTIELRWMKQKARFIQRTSHVHSRIRNPLMVC